VCIDTLLGLQFGQTKNKDSAFRPFVLIYVLVYGSPQIEQFFNNGQEMQQHFQDFGEIF
jgi:hypothetical protein